MYDNRYELHVATDMTQELTFGCVFLMLYMGHVPYIGDMGHVPGSAWQSKSVVSGMCHREIMCIIII